MEANLPTLHHRLAHPVLPQEDRLEGQEGWEEEEVGDALGGAVGGELVDVLRPQKSCILSFHSK